MNLPHAIVKTGKPVIPGFRSAAFLSSSYAEATVTRHTETAVQMKISQHWDWNALALDEFAEFCTALAKQLRHEDTYPGLVTTSKFRSAMDTRGPPPWQRCK